MRPIIYIHILSVNVNSTPRVSHVKAIDVCTPRGRPIPLILTLDTVRVTEWSGFLKVLTIRVFCQRLWQPLDDLSIYCWLWHISILAMTDKTNSPYRTKKTKKFKMSYNFDFVNDTRRNFIQSKKKKRKKNCKLNSEKRQSFRNVWSRNFL